MFSLFVSMSRPLSIYAISLYLCDRFFIFSLIFIVINHIISFKQTYMFLVHFLEYLPLFLYDNVHEESELF